MVQRRFAIHSRRWSEAAWASVFHRRLGRSPPWRSPRRWWWCRRSNPRIPENPDKPQRRSCRRRLQWWPRWWSFVNDNDNKSAMLWPAQKRRTRGERTAHCEYVTSTADTRVRNTLLLSVRPPVRRFFPIVIYTAAPLSTATTTATTATTGNARCRRRRLTGSRNPPTLNTL